ncbi:MAG: ATP-binding protein [Methanomicrobiales archaeon]|nr:ATP-binding protein [Methanomicrobiales archaeon]
MRFFNTAGPVNCEDHYCLPPLTRFNLSEILELIRQKKYFVLHAPRQSGKTSCLMALRDYINHEEQYYAVYVNVEVGQTARGDVKRGIKAIITQLAYEAEETLNDRSLIEQRNTIIEDSGEDAALAVILSQWCKQLDRPLVLLIDEIDALVGDTLISVLRQLRSGYPNRPASFPLTVILCGVRDVRDYRIHSDKDQMIITGGSAFNIKAESLRLGNFSADDIQTLCRQHTNETGQVFDEDALAAIWHLTSGQPWLVNALAYETCFNVLSCLKEEIGKIRSQNRWLKKRRNA